MRHLKNFDIVMGVLVMAILVGLSLALPLKNLDLMWGALAGVAFVWAIFAKQLQVGIPARTFTPTRLARVIVLIIMASVSFGFVYAGLGSPPKLAWLDNVAMVIGEVFLVTGAIAVVVGSVRALVHWGQLTRGRRIRKGFLVLLPTALTPIAINDLINRVRQLAHLL